MAAEELGVLLDLDNQLPGRRQDQGAGMAARFFPLGYALGRTLERRLLPLWLARKPLLVPLAGALALACWGGTVLLTAAGF